MLGRRSWIGGALATLAWPRGVGRAQPPRALLRRFSALSALPWLDLGGLPTPLTRQPALAHALGLGELLLKGDDSAGHTYGGSKARKLELLLGDALRGANTSVLTFGGVGSNHALATAVACRRLGLRCHLALLHEPRSAHARAHLLGAIAQGAVVHPARRADRSDPHIAGRLAPGERVRVIPMGGTSPLGNIGYVAAGFELVAQLTSAVDAIYVTVGTTGTAAGLYVGLRAAGCEARLVGVRASGRGTGSVARVRTEARATVERLRAVDPSFPDVRLGSDFELDHLAVGEGYARPTDAGARAARRCASLGGPTLDPTYTAKAFAALIRRRARHRGERVVFWNTYDARPVPFDGVRASDVPAALRAYARE